MSQREDQARERVERELSWWLQRLAHWGPWTPATIQSPSGYQVAATLAAASLREDGLMMIRNKGATNADRE